MYGYVTDGIDDKVFETYAKLGGNMHLDGVLNPQGRGHTVFGQVYEGMDVVDNIAMVGTDWSDRPMVPQIIESMTVETFGETYPEPEKM